MMSANLRAFLAMIRWCEGTSGPDGYRTIVGGSLFDDFSEHPNILKSGTFASGKEWHSTAAGAYQFLHSTWLECKHALSLPDFSPASQDEAAVFLIKRRGALHAVEEGNLDQAIQILNKEWASLPDSPYGQPTKSLEACKVIFTRAGGTLMQVGGATPSAPPPPTPAEPAPSVGDRIMAIPALVTAAASALLPFISDLMRERGSKTATRNADILEKAPDLVPVIIELGRAVVPGAKNEQEIVDTITASKDLQAQLRAQAAMRWSDIRPFLEFEEESRDKARAFGIQMSEGEGWRAVGFGAILLLLVLGIVYGGGWILSNVLFHAGTDSQTKGMIVGAIIAFITQVLSYFVGSSASSRQKDATISEQAKR